MSDPKIPIFLELRKELETELEALQERREKLREFIKALDEVISTGSFSTADTALGAEMTPPEEMQPKPVEELRSVVLMNKQRDLELASLEITENEIRVIPAAHALYDIKRGAFARFFVERILGKFHEEDREKVETGDITWDDAFDFEVKSDDGILEEIVIRNYGTESRLSEIQRALRWALEKTYRAR
ncbi:hypothetical protein EU537_00715 [Candidatus Thorarchaeota archaeon]|nr:MAG: hypothetical protein EU537_00715 [Candidatus Thorarchaeota archaeon]